MKEKYRIDAMEAVNNAAEQVLALIQQLYSVITHAERPATILVASYRRTQKIADSPR